MSRHTSLVTLSICGVALIGVVWLANAGDLNPPAGPVAPTMRTLDEVYDLVAASSGPADCPPCEWDAFCMEIATGTPPTLIAAGSGVVHTATLNQGCLFRLSDGLPDEGGSYIFWIYNPSTSVHTIPLDVRFENGLYIRGGGGAGPITVTYASDLP